MPSGAQWYTHTPLRSALKRNVASRQHHALVRQQRLEIAVDEAFGGVVGPGVEHALFIEADTRFELSGELRDAAYRGVTLYFTADQCP